MADTGTPPEIPPEFQVYNSYEVDPKWQRKFSIIWASALGVIIVFSLPRVLRALWSGRLNFAGWVGGVRENDVGRYRAVDGEKSLVSERLDEEEERRRRKEGSGKRGWVAAVMRTLGSVMLWSLPGIELNIAQITVIAAYIAVVLACMITDAQLVENANRAGFIAIAQLPVIFLFATKNSILSLLLGPGSGYEKLNFVHRWSARTMFICVVLHGALWIRNHLEWGLEILGEQKETSGIAALGVFCILILSSLRPIRRRFYQWFFVIHVLGFVSFFITICYHTIYASPWIFPPLAFYGFDMLLRFFRYRIKDASLVPIGNQMTLIRIPNCDVGWVAGQHVRLRVFFSGRIFESHPLTIMSAPPTISSTNADGILLGARVSGDWTKALNEYAESERLRLAPSAIPPGSEEKDKKVGHSSLATHDIDVPVQVMIDGPYGGSSVDLGSYESVLLIAGGSGATFTIGMLDDIVGRCVTLNRAGGEKTKRIEFAWCIRSFGAIHWFAPMLLAIANKAANSTLDLHITIFVTCLCDPESVPPIPNSDVVIERPSVYSLIQGLITPPPSSSGSSPSPSPLPQTKDKRASTVIEDEIADEQQLPSSHLSSTKLKWVGLGGGVAVCASGPESLTREAANAVARIGISRGVDVGGIALHTELFAM